MSTNSFCSSDSRSVELSVSSTKNDFGQWKDLFSARTEYSNTLDSITMNVKHNITECDGRGVIHIQGSIQKAGESETGMVFHSRFGTNVIISNNGRTIEKKDIDENRNGAAFTIRPLKNDELFEVMLDKRGKSGAGFGIGILTIRPEDSEFVSHIYESPHVWLYVHHYISFGKKKMRDDYGLHIDGLPAGTRFGVMKKSSGDIHFFVNGADQGSAVSSISCPVYGAVDLLHDGQKVTILKP